MAGRPRKMLARVAALEEVVFQLVCDVYAARPRQYAERNEKEGDDDVAFWWNRVCPAAMLVSISLAELLGAIERKAGLGEEPEQRRFSERGLTPCNEEDNVTETTKGAAT